MNFISTTYTIFVSFKKTVHIQVEKKITNDYIEDVLKSQKNWALGPNFLFYVLMIIYLFLFLGKNLADYFLRITRK